MALAGISLAKIAMGAQVTLLTGPTRSGKTARLLADYRAMLASGRPGAALWLSPTNRAAADIRGRLFDASLRACFRPGVMTFDRFAQSVLDHSLRPIRPLSSLGKRQLLRRIVDQMRSEGRFDYFAQIADTPGAIDLVANWISELKRLEIWPDQWQAACRSRGETEKDRQLTEVYQRYQSLLTRHDLYDAEGRFWSARALLRDGQIRPLENIRLVVADGFADFTRTQHEILEIVADRAERLVVSLPLERQVQREELFAKSRATVNEFMHRHAGAKQAIIDDVSTGQGEPFAATIAALEPQMFVDPRLASADVPGERIEILAAAGRSGEMRRVAGAIKSLLLEGDPQDGRSVRPDEIAVVFRSLGPVAALVRETFDEFGIPFAIESGQTLGESPAIRSLLALLRLERDDWPFRQVLDVLADGSISQALQSQVARIDPRIAAERLVRQFQRPDGREALLKRIDRHVAAPTETTEPNSDAEQSAETIVLSSDESDARGERRRRRDWAIAARPLFAALAQRLDQLPERVTATNWAAALRELIASFGWLAEKDSPATAACESLLKQLVAIDRLAGWIEAPADELSLAQLVDLAEQIARVERLPERFDEAGRVRVLSSPAVRSLGIPYLFFAGLTEKSFPAPAPDSPAYGEAQRRELIAAGLHLARRADRTSEEMLLFYETIARATRRLVLSYPAIDESAEALLPSPYLSEIERAVRPGQLRRTVCSDLSPIPADEKPLCPTDARVRAMHEALAGRESLLSAFVQNDSTRATARSMLRSLECLAARRDRDAFGRFDGMIHGEKAREVFAQKFGPNAVWSASRLERYAECPFRFFVEQVLAVEPLGEMEIETDYSRRGRMLHDALAAAHRRWNAARGEPASPVVDGANPHSESFAEGFLQVLSALAEMFRRDRSWDRSLVEIDLRLLGELASIYVEQHAAYDKKTSSRVAPAFFETSFGMKSIDDGDPLSTTETLAIGEGDHAVQIAGRIDRIDVGQVEGQTVFNVIDYKSGSAAPYGGGAAERLQLELYALAVERLLFQTEAAVPLEVGYWFVGKGGYKQWQSMHEVNEGLLRADQSWPERRDELERTTLALVASVRAGEFPVYSANPKCTSICPFATICRVNEVRSLEKQWAPRSIETS